MYDFQGARAQKSTNAPASTTIYIGNIYEVTDGSATEHIFAGNRRIASKTGSSINYYHPDHLGGLNIATGGTGNFTETTFYYPYGETRVNTGSVDLHYKFTGKEIDRESGLYYYGARYYDPVIGRFISADSVVQSPGDPQTLNRYSYCRNNPLLYTDPSGHVFGIDDFIIAVVLGAAFGATTSAIMGGNVGLGALTGAISGAAFSLAGGAIESWGLIKGVQAGDTLAIAEASGIHFIAGAASGAINAGITGGNVGMSALTSGVSAGVAYGVGHEFAATDWYKNFFPEGRFFKDLATRTAIGSLAGGITSEMAGGRFVQGMGQGAWTSAYGLIFNDFGIITGTLACTALSFGIAWMGTQIAAWGIGNPSAVSHDIDPDTDFAKNYRVSNVTSELTLTTGALTVSAEALVMGSIATAPVAGTFGLSYAPQINQYGLNAVDFLSGYLPGTPPPSAAGYAGFIYGNFQ